MTWVAIGAAAATVVVGAVSSKKSSDRAKKESERARRAALSAEERSLLATEESELMMSPFMGSESAANRQLMIEMGLTPPRETIDSYRDNYQRERRDLVSQISSIEASNKKKKKKGKFGGLVKEGFKGALSGNVEDAVYKGYKDSRKLGSVEDLNQQLIDLDSNYEDKKAEIEALNAQPRVESQPGTAFMSTPGYRGAQQAGIEAVNAGAAGAGSLYSGSRGEALSSVGQQVQQSYYTNYMNILQGMASPTSTSNMANINIGQAGQIGRQNIAANTQAAGYRMAGTEAENQFMADAIGGVTSGVGAYMNRPQGQQEPQQVPQQNTGAPINQTDYSNWV